MAQIQYYPGLPDDNLQNLITEGFKQHTSSQNAPPFHKTRGYWVATESDGEVRGAVTFEVLWDWVYVDELWVNERKRGEGLGNQLMERVEEYARTEGFSGIWLWTQSWQAAGFYRKLGYIEFTRFENFPKGHQRIGLKKGL